MDVRPIIGSLVEIEFNKIWEKIYRRCFSLYILTKCKISAQSRMAPKSALFLILGFGDLDFQI